MVASGSCSLDCLSDGREQILQAIEYMHSNGLVHRDIKSENVMVGANGDIKISTTSFMASLSHLAAPHDCAVDFGFGARLTQNSAKRMTKIGTPLWMAPVRVAQIVPEGDWPSAHAACRRSSKPSRTGSKWTSGAWA